MSPSLQIAAGCAAGLALLIAVPVGLKTYLDAAPQRAAAARQKAQLAALKKQAEAEEVARLAKQNQENAEALQAFQDKNKRILAILNTLKETAVLQPTRPLADAHQLVLEAHFLWKEVRDSDYWLNRMKERDGIDMMIATLVSKVERDKKIRDAFSN